MLKKLFSHTLIYGLAPQVVKVAQIFILPLTTPFLTPVDYGVAGVVTAVVGAVSVFQSLGLNMILSNSFYKSPGQYKWLWRQIYAFLMLWNIVYALLISIIIWFFIPAEAHENRIWIIFLNVFPLVFFGASGNIGSLYYQLKQKPVQIVVRSVIIGFIVLGLNLYFIRFLKMGYMGWFTSAAISSVLLQVSYVYPLYFKLGLRPIFNFKRKTVIKSLKVAAPTLPHYYSSYFLNSFDKFILKILGVPVSQIGIYNAAQTPGNLMASGVAAANQAVGPMLLQCYKNDDRIGERKLNFTVFTSVLIITSLSALFSKEWLPLLIRSKGLENIYTYAVIIIMAYNYRPMYVAANQRLFYVEKTKALLKVSTTAAVISIVLNFILIYFFGIMGAVITLFISLMYMGYSGFFIKEFKESKGTKHYPVFWLLATIVITCSLYFAVELDIKIKILILMAVLAGGLSVFLINKSSALKIKLKK